jgi:hypothetical protein
MGQIGISPYFDRYVQIFWMKNYINACFHPFMWPFPLFLKSNYAFLQICLSKFDGNILEAFAHLFINNCILTNLGKTCWMFFYTTKISPLSINFKVVNIILKLENLIFHLSNDFFGVKPCYYQRSCEFLLMLPWSFKCFKQANCVVFWHPKSIHKKFKIKIKMSSTPLDIQKSKLEMA